MLVTLNAPLSTLHAQGTAFDAVINGTAVSVTLTNSATPVTNGMFVVTLDFGSGVFTGSGRWLDIAVQTNGGTLFTALIPRQSTLPTPYAVMANSASNLLGSLPASQLKGAQPRPRTSAAHSAAT